MEEILYPENLKGLDLNFAEAIYAITFCLEDELHEKDKAEVFAGLGLTPEQMAKNAEKVLDAMYHHLNSYALCRVLGDLDASQDEQKFGQRWTLASSFEAAYADLKGGGTSDPWRRANFRYILLGGQSPWGSTTTAQLGQTVNDASLRERIEQLTAEVEFYAERCSRALEQLQTLTAVIEDQESAASNAALENVPANSAVIDGIYWPYRSAEVLRKLSLTKIEEIVEFFGDFRKFLGAKDITLMEWSVITTILRKKELLPATGNTVVIERLIDDFEFSVRTRNCLTRAGIKDVEGVMFLFADGAEDGLGTLMRVRNLGRKSYEEIIQKLMTLDFTLEDSWCYVTDISPVGALDFSKGERQALCYYKIQTVGQLYTACQDQNRFSGLRYIDNELYKVAIKHLDRYGFCC